jgi:hypothetical protein
VQRVEISGPPSYWVELSNKSWPPTPSATTAEGGVQAGSGERADGAGHGAIIYFKLYKSQIPVIEQALETAALMLGSDGSPDHEDTAGR